MAESRSRTLVAMAAEGADGLRPLMAEVRELVAEHGRDDLVAQLDRVQQQLDAPARRVVVAGDFKQGKSSLVSALIGADVCPVADDRSTATVTEVVPSPRRKKTSAELTVGDSTRHLTAKQVTDVIFETPADAGERWWTARVTVLAPSATGPALLDLPGHHGASGAPVIQA